MKKLFIMILIPFILVIASCKGEKGGGDSVYSFTDALGRKVEIHSFDRTVVLSGSLAEIWQLAGGEIYGTTDDAFERGIIDLSGNEKKYGGVQSIATERLIADGADFVILSANISSQVKLGKMLESAGMTIAYFDVETFDDYLKALKICTDITGREDLYIKNGEEISGKVENAKKSASGKEAPKILLLRAISTGMKALGSDNMTGSMLGDLGCINIADSESSLLESISLEAVVREDPDYIFITTIGDSEAGLAQYRAELLLNPAWQQLGAVKNGRVHILPKELYHYKPNVRWDEAYINLYNILYETE